MTNLYVLYRNRRVGLLSRDTDGQFLFTYDRQWLTDPPFAISLSLPLRSEPYVGGPARRFFENLLPEGIVRRLLTRRLGISEDNDFQLLAAIGGECAGALSICDEGAVVEDGERKYRELTAQQINEFLRQGSALASIDGQDDLRLSLAGAQDKLPVFVEHGKLYLPLGGAPSSHILKFPNKDFKHLPANETLMALIAREAGLNTAATELLIDVADEPLCLVERYDRKIDEDGNLQRLHQEDFCQALNVDSHHKYEGEGGPSYKDCFELLSQYSLEPLLDTRALIDWLAFNVAIGNADGHAKNISLIYQGPGVRLASSYDLVCTQAYPSISRALAMGVGGCKVAGDLSTRNLEALASELGVGRRFLVARMRAQFERVGEATESAVASFKERFGNSPAIQMTIPKIRKSVRKLLDSTK